jgi:UDP-N-acetyl-D-mannosaminuronic acid dehydrogenase
MQFMPSVLTLTTQEMSSPENRLKYTVGVVGCGQRGILYANLFAEAGFKVTCNDADQSLVKKLAKGKSVFAEQELEKKLKNHIANGNLKVSSEIKDTVSQSDIIVVAIPVKIDERKSSDSKDIVNACKQIGSALHLGSLVIYGEISGVGLFEGAIKDALENTSGLKTGKDFCLAYAPFPNGTQNLEFKVAATDQTSLNVACAILSTLSKNVTPIGDVKTAELTQLFQAVKADLQTALANELAVYCESAGIDYFEVTKLLKLNADFSPAVVEEKGNSEIYLLLENAESLNAKLRLPTLARQINEEMIKHGVALTQEALRSCGKTLRRVRVTVFGEVNSHSSTEQFAKLLAQKGAKAAVYDPLLSRTEALEASGLVKKTLNEAVEGVDCIVILSPLEQFKRLNLKKLHTMMKSPAAIVDLVDVVEPEKVEAEGFTFRGLGKGLRKN